MVSVEAAAVWRWFARGDEGSMVKGLVALGERCAFWSSILEMSGRGLLVGLDLLRVCGHQCIPNDCRGLDDASLMASLSW